MLYEVITHPGRLDILAVGTMQGAPVPLPGEHLLKDERGQPVIARTDLALLAETARAVGGRFARVDDTPALTRLRLPPEAGRAGNQRSRQLQDLGYWLLLPLPGLAVLFRRGLLWLPALLLLLPVRNNFV